MGDVKQRARDLLAQHEQHDKTGGAPIVRRDDALRAIEAALHEADAVASEVARLTACLKIANSQAEEFERKWYLAGDEADEYGRQRDEAIASAEKAEADAGGRDAVRALPEKWRNENGDYPDSKRDCADELEAAIAQREVS